MSVLDDHWILEASVLKLLSGAGAEARAALNILAELPREDRSVPLATAVAKLEAMSASQMMKMSPTGVQASLRYIVRLLGNLAMGLTIDEKPDTCSSLVRKAICQFY